MERGGSEVDPGDPKWVGEDPWSQGSGRIWDSGQGMSKWYKGRL